MELRVTDFILTMFEEQQQKKSKQTKRSHGILESVAERGDSISETGEKNPQGDDGGNSRDGSHLQIEKATTIC